MSRTDLVWRLDGVLLDLLTELVAGDGIELERVQAGAYVVTLHGERRRSMRVWLLAGEQAVGIEAFLVHVVAVPDPSLLHRWLLRKNLTLRSVHFALDEVGDLFLVGSLPHDAVTAHEVDRVLGELLTVVEESWEAILALAYGDRLATDPALAAKVASDGAGRRPAGTPDWAPRRDIRR